MTPGAIRHRLTPKARIDRSLVGISFVDVLFALVVGQILEPLEGWDQLTLEAYLHIGVAFVLTVGSWIGYHNSFNKPHYVIGFINLPLWQFLLDVSMVIVYWLTASFAEGVHASGAGRIVRAPSAIPEATLVSLSFLLYVVWDWVARTMRFDEKYKLFRRDLDKPIRRTVTRIGLLVSVVIAGAAWWVDAESRTEIIIFDTLLMVLLVAYRVVKEAIGGRPEVPDDETLEDELQEVVDKVDKIRRSLQEGGKFPA